MCVTGKRNILPNPNIKYLLPVLLLCFCIVVDCGPLRDPDSGMVDTTRGTTYNYYSRATYACDSGYILNGTDSRICQPDGFWPATEPVCYRKQGLK